MKVIMRENGWDEITTVEIRITHFPDKIFATVGDWIETIKTRPRLDTNGRNHCQLCGIKWIDSPPELNTYLLFTTKGNKVICENCRNKFIK